MNIAVIDTETNWNDEIMSIGIAVAHRQTLELVDAVYYVLTPEVEVGGMYTDALLLEHDYNQWKGSRRQVMGHLRRYLNGRKVQEIFAYNARFDYGHMPELAAYDWFDIMRLAAYRQYNHSIPAEAECYSTGRLRRNYGVEATLRRLTGDHTFRETHNALYDALDELKIMQLLGHEIETYACGRINAD